MKGDMDMLRRVLCDCMKFIPGRGLFTLNFVWVRKVPFLIWNPLGVIRGKIRGRSEGGGNK